MPNDDDRLLSPIPAPSEAQVKAGADRDPNAKLAEPVDAQPPMSDDQRSTAIDGNAPHTPHPDDVAAAKASKNASTK